ncbi:uncharacterized protein LOC119178430 [Rhipicephalus microplus]|uniref:Putative conserved secreted protein midgut overexpressed n=1 Tax=Rhipicephalus microplus TaxID=6941 RepID=A0A6M2CIE0_RHIMP|nr:uncharacterized protein LOC119178430 [Rhipicephalus microplus]
MTHVMMKPSGAVLCVLLLCIMSVSSQNVPEKYETLDIIVDKEAQRVGLEAVQVGEVLHAIAHGLRTRAQHQEGAENQSQHYFLDKILKAVGELVKGAGNAVKGVAEGVGNAVGAITFSRASGVVTTEAADILRKIVSKDLSLYATEDGKVHKDFRQQIANDLSRVAESLIHKGQVLCAGRGRTHLNKNEAKFVQMVVELF